MFLPLPLAAAVVSDTFTQGGATLTPALASPLAGYAVADRPDLEHRMPPAGLTPAVLAAYAGSLPPDEALGTWMAPDGTACLDASRVLPDHDAALALARATHQQAIYDLATGQTEELR